MTGVNTCGSNARKTGDLTAVRNEKADLRRPFLATLLIQGSALASLEARVGFADDKHFSAATDDLAVTMASFG
jgi:hypothetical protein